MTSNQPRPLSRRGLLRATVGAGIGLTAGGALAAAGGGSAYGATATSPRARLLATNTNDTLRLGLYQFYARNGLAESQPPGTDLTDFMTKPQVSQIANLYDVILATNGPEPAATLKQARHDIIISEYEDIIWRYSDNPIHADWDWINAHEDMFAHSSLSPWPNQRIANPFFPKLGYGLAEGSQPGSWLMNPYDIDYANPTNRAHWMNYFTGATGDRIKRYKMDGLLIDEAMNQYSPIPPDGYNEADYHHQIYKATRFVRDQLGADKVICWNGIQLDSLTTPTGSILSASPPNGMPVSLDLLDHLDGAVIEWFVTSYLTTGTPVAVLPEPLWTYTMNLAIEIQRRGGVMLAQSPVGADDRNIRMLTLASFYLVKGQRAYLHHGNGKVFNDVGNPSWFPEWGIRMGVPLTSLASVTDYLVTPGHKVGLAVGTVYAREFEQGWVLANPSPLPAVVTLAQPGYLAHGTGGGEIPPDGVLPAGDVSYSSTQIVQLPPQSGAIVRHQPQAPGTHLPQRPGYRS